MNEITSIDRERRNTAADCIDISAEAFKLATGFAVWDAEPRPNELRPRPNARFGSLSDSNTTKWIASIFRSVEIGSLPPMLEPRGIFVSENKSRFLSQIKKDLDELGASLHCSTAAQLCRKFAEGVGIAIATQVNTRWAVFGDEEDAITLVAHCRTTKRQVAFEFPLSTPSINIVQIDEHMCRQERTCRIDHVLQLGTAIEWLNRR